jgi:hypothetical protein
VKLVMASGSTLKWLVRQIPFVDRLLGYSSHDRLVASLACPSRDRERSIAALREIREALRAAGVPVQVYLLPANFGSYSLQRRLYDGASRIVEDTGLPVRSLLDAFAATGRVPREFRVSMIDSHPDAAYGRIAARSIFEHLRESGTINRLVAVGTDGGSQLPAAADRRTASGGP